MKLFILLFTTILLSAFSMHLGNYNSRNPKRTLAPQNVNASDGDFPSKINITWDKVAGNHNIFYQVYRGESPAIEDMELIKAPASKETYVIDRYQIKAGKVYFYRVRAGSNSLDISAYSEPDSGFIRNVALPPIDSSLILSDSLSLKKDK